VFSITRGPAGTAGPPVLSLRRSVALPGEGSAYGVALTPDGRDLLVTSDRGVDVLATGALEHGGAAVEGTLTDGGQGDIEVTATPDSRYLVVSEEDSNDVGVFDLALALQKGFATKGVALGRIPTGAAPVGIAVSPDGRWLFVTSEIDNAAGGRSNGCGVGSLSLISVASAEHDPAGVKRVVAPAGGNPVRVALGDRGAIAWVTARASDALVAFSTARLESATPGGVVTDALVASVSVGLAPVGVVTAEGGRIVVVADSDRFGGGGSPQWLTVVGAAEALAGRPALLGQVATGAFPRDLTVSPDGSTVYVSDFSNSEVQAVDIGALDTSG